MKAIAWDYKTSKFQSPSSSQFKWTREGLESAECTRCGENLPEKECSCGLYATFRWDEATGYRYNSPISPILLFEASGKSQFYQDVIRAKQLAPRWVIMDARYNDTFLTMATFQARDYFNVPIISKSVAISIMDLWNITWFLANRYTFKTSEGEPIELPYWRDWYEPEGGDQISKLSDEWINHLAQTYFGGKHGKSTT